MRQASGSAPSILSQCFVALVVPWLAVSCGGGGSSASLEMQAVQGRVLYGTIAAAIVCIDQNRNGRCDEAEPQTRSDSAGSYLLSAPKGEPAPLVAEVVAGQSRDLASGTVADASYRMASPSLAYGAGITPFSTMAHLTGEADYVLADEMVRNMLGLPPHYEIRDDTAPAAGSLTQAVAASVIAALKTVGAPLAVSDAGLLERVCTALPKSLTDLPVLRIATKNAAPIVSREVYVDATFELTNPALSSLPAALNGKIRGRGHSTWGQPKNPYKVVFKDDASLAKVSDMLGMKKSRYWVLLADWFDRSLLRNKLAYSLGNSATFSGGLKWTPSAQHLEVYLNGDYIGLYLLAEDIRIAPERLALRKMSDKAADGQVDGGYIVEVDARLDCYNDGTINLQHHTPQGAPVCIDTPDESAITPAQLAYVKALLDKAETDIYGRNDLAGINAESFADWYLLSELFRNNDAVFWTSDFMWKDTDGAASPKDRVLNMGPLWDFDLSAGNINYNDNWMTEGCWVSRALPYSPSWIARLLENPDFVALTIARWKEKRPALAKFINASIDTYAERIEAAQQRNFARWPILGTQLLNYYTFTTHAEEVAFLKRFLNDRMAWLDRAYESTESFRLMCK